MFVFLRHRKPLNENLKFSLDYYLQAINVLDGFQRTMKDACKPKLSEIGLSETPCNMHTVFITLSLRKSLLGCETETLWSGLPSPVYDSSISHRYKSQVFTLAHNKVLLLERSKLISSKPKQEQAQKPYFATCYSIKNIRKKKWETAESNNTLWEIFTEPPGIRFRSTATIKDKLVCRSLSAPNQKIGSCCCGNCN